MKAMEFTEKGATNVPNGYWGVNGIMGFYPSSSVAQAYEPFFSQVQLDYTDKTVLTFLINTYMSKYCDIVSRFTPAQYNFPTFGGTMATELYRILYRWESQLLQLRTKYSMDLTAIISKIKTTRNTIFPSQP